jgi:salicylate hydroxylase
MLIAGGGIAGLAAALAMAGIGRSARLFEQAAEFAEVGAGLQMSPNAVSALRRLGAWEAVEPACVVPSEIHVRSGRSGTLLQRIRLGKPFEERFGAPYRVCHRADLLAGLVATARGRENIELNTASRVVSAKSGSDGAELALESGRIETGRAAIAADGIASRLRPAIAGPADPVYRGHAVFRSLIAFADVPPAIVADCVTLWLCPGGHVVHYPVSNWRSFNIVAALASADVGGGWGVAGDAAEIDRVFGTMDDGLAGILALPASWLKWRAADLAEVRPWSKGNVVLIGDAAHATLPYLAQGAAMALEDACVLARAVAAHDSCAEAFAAYEAERRSRTARIQLESRRLGTLYHARGVKAAMRDAALRLTGPERALARNAWIYAWRPAPVEAIRTAP